MFEKNLQDVIKTPLLASEIDSVSGGRFKRPLQRPITVYYDDGISVLTSDPSTSNVVPNIK
jgi:hypothetical protein